MLIKNRDRISKVVDKERQSYHECLQSYYRDPLEPGCSRFQHHRVLARRRSRSPYPGQPRGTLVGSLELLCATEPNKCDYSSCSLCSPSDCGFDRVHPRTQHYQSWSCSVCC